MLVFSAAVDNCMLVGVERLSFVCLRVFSLYSVGCVVGMANDRLRALEDVEKEIALVLQSAGLCHFIDGIIVSNACISKNKNKL